MGGLCLSRWFPAVTLHRHVYSMTSNWTSHMLFVLFHQGRVFLSWHHCVRVWHIKIQKQKRYLTPLNITFASEINSDISPLQTSQMLRYMILHLCGNPATNLVEAVRWYEIWVIHVPKCGCCGVLSKRKKHKYRYQKQNKTES